MIRCPGISPGRLRRTALPAIVLCTLALVVSPQARSLQAQEAGEMVDRVAAVVGDSIILLTQIEEQIFRLQASGVTIPEEPSALVRLRRELVETLVNQQLVLQAALRDTTISVPEDRVEQVLEQTLAQQLESFGSEEALQRALTLQGQTNSQYRASLADEIRRELLQERYLETQRRQARVIPVEESEMRAFYESQRTQLQERPATLTFRQILLSPSPSDSARAVARQEAERILGLLAEGQEFEALASRLSQDPGSRQEGGDLGWFRRGVMVPEFEDTAFNLREQEVSGVVETDFGAHIIRVDRIRGGERRARHILIAAEVSPTDVAAVESLAADLAQRARGGESFRALVEEYHNDASPDSLAIRADRLSELPPGYAASLEGAEPGAVVGPIQFGSGPATTVAVIQVLEVRDEGEFTFEDLQEQIRQQIREQKFQERVIEGLRERSFVEVRI
ncbi:MAG: peptidylprolyl isomerase [Gemmatimonadota bacterium]